jgi:NAD(P)-dependent dehydrogenase (short-subunit alcohol dehydrogenase family)
MVHSSVNGFAIVTGVCCELTIRHILLTDTKAAGGIGKEIVFALAEAGAKGVLCADLKGDEASKVAEESKSFATVLDFRAFVFEVDITDAQSVQALAEFGLKQFGRVDYLVNAAGVSF